MERKGEMANPNTLTAVETVCEISLDGISNGAYGAASAPHTPRPG